MTDTDEEVCWESPILDISMATGAVSLSVDLEWVGYDAADYIDVKYSINGGGYTTIMNVVGATGRTIGFTNLPDPQNNTGTTNVSQGSINGNTLKISVCTANSASSEFARVDNISVPEANVVILPVELILFFAKSNEAHIELFWLTASEINNEKFEIEESQDGREFQKIGEVIGSGTTLEQQNYSFEVKNPRNGISYYRLKQIDYDGQFEYSKLISVNFKVENGEIGGFYPNPSKSGTVNLDYTSENDDEILVSVFDVTGKLIVNQIQQVSNGDNNLSFDFSELNTGIYIVKICDERNPTHRKLIIER